MNGDVLFSMEIAQLIERCRLGDAEALGELYKAYAQQMRGVCRRYFSDEQTINDVLHDAFVIIFTSFDKLRNDKKAASWMMSITRNVASKYKAHLTITPIVPLEEAERLPIPEEKTEANSIVVEDVLRLIERLPEGYGKVFRLSVFEGLSHKEIADMLGIEPHSSSSQLTRAKKMLRKMMQQYWAAMLLLLLIPLLFYLFRKGDTAISIEEKPVVARKKTNNGEHQSMCVRHKRSARLCRPALQRTENGERRGKPMIVHLPKRHTTIITADIQRSAIAYASDTLHPSPITQHQVTDTISEDTTKIIRPDVQPQYDIADLWPDKSVTKTGNEKKWSLELTYAGQFDEQNRYNQPFSFKPISSDNLSPPEPDATVSNSIDNWTDYAVYLANNPDAVSDKTRSVIMRIALNNAPHPGGDKILRSSHHRMPVTWSLALKYRLNNRFGIESGLSYSRLTSDFEMGTDGNTIREQQTIHYLGIPVKGIYNMYSTKPWGIYGSVGMTTEIPVHSTLHSDYYVNGRYEVGEKTTLHTPWQFSTTFGLGLQYHLTPNVGFFMEPSLQYFIPKHSNIETYRTEHPFTFSLPLGIRFTW